jgi:hypothetical protein
MRFVKGVNDNMHITSSIALGDRKGRPDNSRTFRLMLKRIRQQIRNCEITQIAIDVNNGLWSEVGQPLTTGAARGTFLNGRFWRSVNARNRDLGNMPCTG